MHRITQAVHSRIKGFLENLQYLDYGYIAILLLLMSFGLVMMYSSSYFWALSDGKSGTFYFKKQALICLGSLLVMLFVAGMDYQKYIRLSWLWLLITYALMLMVKFSPLGTGDINGAKRWLMIPGTGLTFQPTEVTKIAMILLTAFLIDRMGNEINHWNGIFRIGGIVLVTCAIVFFGNDHLSSAIIIFGIVYIMVTVTSRKSRVLTLVAVFGACIAVAGVRYLATIMDNSGFFRLRRLLVWVNPEKYAQDGGYQIIQGLYAIGSGGFLGKGLGNSSQKLGAIPESQNDMIVSIIGEELGIFGIMLLLLLFAFLLYRLLRIAREAVDLQGSLIVMGIFAHIALQVILNFCVVLNLIPTTGITLPFISYGGTATVFLMIEMGIVLGVSAKSHRQNEEELSRLEAMEEE